MAAKKPTAPTAPAPGTEQSAAATVATTTESQPSTAAAPAPAPAPAPALGESAAPADSDKQPEAAAEVEGVYVRATLGRRCRAGFCFDQEGQYLSRSLLTDRQLIDLQDDPLLRVEHCTFPAEADA